MTEQPKVSVLVPVYGVEKYIERCAVSLMEQTYRNIEYVFVDDKTRDRSITILEEVIARYPDRKAQVRILHHAVNQGISVTRNTAFDAATGDYLYQVDSDDYLATDAIQRLVDAAQTTQADIVLFDIYEVRPQGVVERRIDYADQEGYIRSLLMHTTYCAHWNKFYRAEFLRRTQVRCVEGVRLADDYAVTPRLLHQARKVEVLHAPLYYYETSNQTSYVHNLTIEAIQSQHMADSILVDYFSQVTDKERWQGIVGILPQRTVVSLVKQSTSESRPLIRQVYATELTRSGAGMSLLNKTIYTLFTHQQNLLLSILLPLYRWVMSLR